MSSDYSLYMGMPDPAEDEVETSALRVWRWCAVVLLLLATTVFAQSPPQNPPTPPAQQPPPAAPQTPDLEMEGADSDPLRVTLLQVRNEYYKLSNGNWQDALIIRSDRAFLRTSRWGGKVGLLTRFDIPIVTAHLPTGVTLLPGFRLALRLGIPNARVQVNSSTHAGLGDVYGQFIVAPLLTRRFALFFGSGVSIPSATYRTLGLGKWTAAPLGGPLCYFGRGRGFALIKFQDFTSFAGNSNRPPVRYVLVTPTVLWAFHPPMWVLVREESHTDLTSPTGTWYTAGLQVGRVFNGKVAAWITPEVLWGPQRPGNFNLKISFAWKR